MATKAEAEKWNNIAQYDQGINWDPTLCFWISRRPNRVSIDSLV
jgi:hypothetical protein